MTCGVLLLFVSASRNDQRMAVAGAMTIGFVSVAVAGAFLAYGLQLTHALTASKFTDPRQVRRLYAVIGAFSLAWVGGGVIW
jgi:hypothetical protein